MSAAGVSEHGVSAAGVSTPGVTGPGVTGPGVTGQRTGAFVAEQLDVTIHTSPSSAVNVAELVGLALRRNPKRAHLLVSTVLAKHIPTEPALVIAAGGLLGAFVAHEFLTSDAGSRQPPPGPPSAGPGQSSTEPDHLSADLRQAASTLGTVLASAPGQRREAIATFTEEVAALRTEVPDAVVIGYAETATGLGRLVANHLGAYYIHSTRHATPGVAPVAGFEEGHSHATSHSMVPTDPDWLAGSGPVVLVDDEFSTGSTVINTIRELHALHPHDTYVVAALIDLRSAADRARFDELAAELGCRIFVTALGTGSVDLGEDILARAAALIKDLPRTGSAQALPIAAPAAPTPQVPSAPQAGRLSFLELSASALTPVRSDRFGNAGPPSVDTIAAVAGHVAAQLESLGAQGPVVVLGCEENMFLPVAVAQELDVLRPDANVRFSTTTRSPIVALERDDYAIAGALTFASHDLTNDGPGVRFAYNLTGTGQRPGTLVVFPEPGTDRHAVTHTNHLLQDRNGAALPSLAGALSAAAGDVVVVLLPASTPHPPTEDTP